MKILYLLPDLGYSSAARQVSLIAPALDPARFTPQVAVLGRAGPLAGPLLAAGIRVHELSESKAAGLRSMARLERLIRDEEPDVIHAWRLPAMRAVCALRFGKRKSAIRFFVSEPQRGGRWNPLDFWFLARADRVFAEPGQAKALHRPGMDSGKVNEIPMAVAPPIAKAAGPEFPTDARVILCVGNLTANHGFRDAIWSFDVLKFVFPDTHLIVIGDGPERERLEQFGRSIGQADFRVRFLPARPDAAALMPAAVAVWVPSRKPCGFQVALEAQAAGVPVLATRLPGLEVLVEDGVTGLLVPPGDPVALARQTRTVLENPDLARRLTAAGRERIASRHAVSDVARRWAEAYSG